MGGVWLIQFFPRFLDFLTWQHPLNVGLFFYIHMEMLCPLGVSNTREISNPAYALLLPAFYAKVPDFDVFKARKKTVFKPKPAVNRHIFKSELSHY